MEKKKMSIVIAAIIAAIALVLIVVAVVISLLGDNKIKEKGGYKQCAKSEDIGEKKLTNFKHTGLNYYIDKENNRINNSEVILTKNYSRHFVLNIVAGLLLFAVGIFLAGDS